MTIDTGKQWRAVVAALPLICAGVRRLLRSVNNLEIVGETHHGGKLAPLLRQRPDLLIVQSDLKGLRLARLLVQSRSARPIPKVLVIEGFVPLELNELSLLISPDAFFLRDSQAADFLVLVESVCV